MSEIERPDCVTDEHLDYLDDLRKSGNVNMFGARPYLLLEYPNLSKKEAGQVLAYWMQTFGDETR